MSIPLFSIAILIFSSYYCYPSFCANDTEAPNGPYSLNVSNVTQTTTDLSWEAATDNVGVVSYDISMNGIKVLSTDGNTLSVTVTGLTPSTWYLLEIVSIDAAGNVSNGTGIEYVFTKHSSCGVFNNWIGNSSDWADDPSNWSANATANACQNVVINNGATVTIPSNESYACATLDVGLGSELNVELGSEFLVLPSQPGPFSIIGEYIDTSSNGPLSSCGYNGSPCEFTLSFLEDYSCYADFVIDASPCTYTINGDILSVDISNPIDIFGYSSLEFKIIDNNNLLQIGTADMWSLYVAPPVYIRLKNVSSVTFQTSNYNGEEYGVLAPNEVSEYKHFDSSYSYGYFSVTAENEIYEIQPIDFVGEELLDTGYYTFELSFGEFGLTYNLIKD